MKILLDTNFILTCAKQKIDFFDILQGKQILIPKQVIDEIKNVADSKQKLSAKNRKITTTQYAHTRTPRNKSMSSFSAPTPSATVMTK